MKRHTGPRRRGLAVAVVLVLAVVMLLGVTATAHAGVINSWRVQPKGTVSSSLPIIVNGGGTFDANPLDIATVKLFIDGSLVPRASYVATTPFTRNLYLYYSPQPKLADGLRTFRVEIADRIGRLSSYQWTATIAEPPSAVWRSPAAGSTSYEGRPAIELEIGDNTPGSALSVAGEIHADSATGPVVGVFGGSGLSAGVNTFTPSVELEPGTYYLTASVTDEAGISRFLQGTAARKFAIVRMAAMSLPPSGCLDAGCHVTSGHPTSGRTCAGCHVAVYHEYSACEDCHGGHDGAPVTVTGIFGPCTVCHNVNQPTVPGHTAASVQPSHIGSCAGCHNESLIDVHSSMPAGSTYPFQCDMCHDGSIPRVAAAVAAGDTTCSACHDADHEAMHAVTVSAECIDCHAGTSLTGLHVELGCDVCHASADDAVLAAIDTGNKACSACHAAQPHPDLELTHLATMTSAPMEVFSYHDSYPNGMTWDLQCSMCHASSQLLTVHDNDCRVCHSGTKPADSFTVWNGGCQQGDCHPTLEHSLGQSAHTPYVNANCDTCHEPDFSVWIETCEWCHDPATRPAPVTTSNVKTSYVGTATIAFSAPGIAWTSYRLDGGLRNGGGTLVVQGPASGSEAHTVEYWSVNSAGVEELPHKNAAFTIAADTAPPVTTSNALPLHGGATTITLTATDNNSTPVQEYYWRLNGGALMTGRTISVPEPANGTVDYSLEFWSVDPSGNEELPHKSVDFSVAKDTLPPVTTSNAPAYDRSTSWTYVTLTRTDPVPASGVAATWYRRDGLGPYQYTGTPFAVTGQGIHTIQFWSVDRSGNTETPVVQTIVKDWTPPITGSDAQTSYVGSATIHLTPGDAVAGVANTYYILDGDPQASGTEITVTTDGSHTLKYWSVDKAGNIEAQKTRTFTVSGGVPDTAPPTTTSNAVTAYTGGATILLTAGDGGGSGVAATYYELDGAPAVAGTTVNVPMPASGTIEHTLRFWSVDVAGNAESPTTIVFTCSYSSGVTLRLVWGDADTSGFVPEDGSSADWTIRNGGPSGAIVAVGGNAAGSGWDGVDDIVVPYQTGPYWVIIDWWDSSWDEGGTTLHYPVYVTGGSIVRLTY